MNVNQERFQRVVKVDVDTGEVDLETITGEVERRMSKQTFFNKREAKILKGVTDSLKPLLREAFNLYGIDEDDGFWVDLEQRAPFSPETAVAKLRSVRKDSVDGAIYVWSSLEAPQREKFFGRLNDDSETALIAQLAHTISKRY